MNLTENNKKKLREIGINESEIQTQFQNLKNGPDALDLKAPCTVGNGIKVVSNDQKKVLISNYETLIEGKTVSRFTPASGAATRMFKHLYNPENNEKLVAEFVARISEFAFFEELTKEDLQNSERLIQTVLTNTGLNYGQLPKALISFHKYSNTVRKAIDEQLVEGVNYVNQKGISRFHFTISESHKELVNAYLKDVLPPLESQLNTKFEISFSTQQKSTDTVALNSKGELVTDENGDLLLRPGGHGALIHNLNLQNEDIVFVKNIDNIVREEYQEVVVDYKKMLGSLLVNLQQTVFGFLKELETEKVPTSKLATMVEFIQNELNISVTPNQAEITNALNRPIRVCGMVKNEGKAGGGPFWVGNSVQIVESAQMDESKPEIAQMLQQATHFNPVDLVCGLKNYQGKKFDLSNFVDPSTFFVSSKSYQGEEIKVLEHPGLWNGAMANWLTVFVEIPVDTFHPVKTVNDLLQKVHGIPNLIEC